MNTLTTLTYLASAAGEAQSEGFFEALGIDWMLLILQGIAFLVLVAILAKFVYPVFMRIIDERQEAIEASSKAAAKAAAQAESSQAETEKLLKKARSEAAEIVATAKSEATAMVEKADGDAKARAERIVAEAHEDIQKEVVAAKKALEKDTLRLVKEAASLATAGVADSKLDSALIKKSVQEVAK